MIKANNLWEQDALRKHTTTVAVDAEIQRCNIGRLCAATDAKRAEWARKLSFLDKLRVEVSRP